jgi:hypothetical protein
VAEDIGLAKVMPPIARKSKVDKIIFFIVDNLKLH